jgi:hypothetical protein
MGCGVSYSWLPPLFKRRVGSFFNRLLKAGGGLKSPTPLQINAMVLTPEMSKRFRQRMFLHMALSSSSTM